MLRPIKLPHSGSSSHYTPRGLLDPRTPIISRQAADTCHSPIGQPLLQPRIATVPRIPAQYLIQIISCAMCHHLSGATWPASRHWSDHRTTGQRWSTATVNGGQRRSTAADHRRTTAGPPVNHQSTVVDRQSTGGSWLGLGPGLDRVGIGSATWRHMSADVAADVA
ncbi:hypothetical protein Tco_0935768 [Tanacetum coccineum]